MIIDKNFIEIEESNNESQILDDISPIKKKQSTLPAISNNKPIHTPNLSLSASAITTTTSTSTANIATTTTPQKTVVVPLESTPLVFNSPPSSPPLGINTLSFLHALIQTPTPNIQPSIPLTNLKAQTPTQSKLSKVLSKANIKPDLSAFSSPLSTPSSSVSTTPLKKKDNSTSLPSPSSSPSPSKKKPHDPMEVPKYVKNLLKDQERKFAKLPEMLKDNKYGLMSWRDAGDCMRICVIGGGEVEYTLTLGPTFTCSCPDYKKRISFCKHLPWLLISQFHLDKSHWALYQRGFTNFDRYYLLFNHDKFQATQTRIEAFIDREDETDYHKVLEQIKIDEANGVIHTINDNSNDNNNNNNNNTPPTTKSEKKDISMY